MDSVLSFIAQGLHREFEDPANNVGYESAEGGYLLPPIESSDLFEDLGLSESEESFFEDLCCAFAWKEWVKTDPYGLAQDEELIAVWERFSAQVRHETRFVFFQVTTDLQDEIGGGSFYEPHQVLQSLGDLVRQLDLLTTLPVDTRILRARQHVANDRPKRVTEIAPLPPEKATQQNRFSPAGIPMFYGADDAKTAFIEIASTAKGSGDHVTYGSFRNNRELELLDLTKLPPMASVFDPEKAHLRAPISFLNHFICSARKEVDPAASSIEYVPTQVIVEYFRHIFRICGETRLDGIIYNSSKAKGGRCYTLFLGAEECGEPKDRERALRLCSLRTRPFTSEKMKYLTPSEEDVARHFKASLQSRRAPDSKA